MALTYIDSLAKHTQSYKLRYSILKNQQMTDTQKLTLYLTHRLLANNLDI